MRDISRIAHLASGACVHPSGLGAARRIGALCDAWLMRTERTSLFAAIPLRQCTRNDYDGSKLRSAELNLLERAGSSPEVRVLLITERPRLEQVLEQIVAANTAQMADRAFVTELKSWIRFNGAQAAGTRDGLFTLASGNPVMPSWVGSVAFDWFFKPGAENDKIARQIRSAAGVAVFFGQAADKASWVQVGPGGGCWKWR